MVKPPTPRQLQILELIADGVPQKQIAKQMFTSRSAVAMQMHRMRAALGAVSNENAIKIGYESGLLRVGERWWS